ncbi:PREDICTED: amino acid permease 8-like [Fragaria vesca subsp. vesca]|uniref:amino acid permease 8-like n=1 Tax=Fragaria vesca subsp. vesca TaxID=101020 RepID=UPI0002C3788B|nr:PREDICTED: amino acid permease 8-like [Fragaria vesca subsp. vesca]
MALSEVEAGFRHELSESGLNNPAKIAEAEEELLVDDDGKLKRTGTVWTGCAHIITTSIGAGVLSLAWAMAQLGWLAGIFILLFCTFTAGYAATLLADCYRFPDPVLGKRNYSYMEAVKVYLGGTMHKIGGWILYLDLATIGVGFTITTAKSLVAIQKSNCHRKNGEDSPCMFSYIPHMVGFALVEILLSQLPNFHKLTWLSKLAAIMSFVYATIGIGLSLAKIISGDGGKTFLAGEDQSSSEKIWMMFIAAGDIAFACSYALVLFEIQDTLKSSPAENKVMKKVVVIGGLTMTVFFMMCSSLGYAAFGNKTPENLLAGFGDDMPWAFWLLDIANFCIVVHIVGAFQVLCQPVFRIVEVLAGRRWPKSDFVTKENLVRLGNMKFTINMFRLTWRTSFVVLATVIAMAMPFFTDMLALLGAIGYWPLIVYIPIEMHIVQNKIQKKSLHWFGLQLLSFLCFLLSLAAASGSIYGLHKGLGAYKLFQARE